MSPSRREVEVEFFVDRSLGANLVVGALRDLGLVVHTPRSLFGSDEEKFGDDVDWLREVGNRDLVVLMKDRRIRYRPAEIAALKDSGVRAFCLSTGSLPGPVQAERFVRNSDRILAACKDNGPFMYMVYEDRIRRIYP